MIVFNKKQMRDMHIKEIRWGNIIGSKLKPEGWRVYSTDFEFINENPDDYFGVPLTPEWLESVGFKKKTLIRYEKALPFNGYYSQTLVFVLGEAYIMENEDLNHQSKIGACKYLHQLQNIYYIITGQELELKP